MNNTVSDRIKNILNTRLKKVTTNVLGFSIDVSYIRIEKSIKRMASIITSFLCFPALSQPVKYLIYLHQLWASKWSISDNRHRPVEDTRIMASFDVIALWSVKHLGTAFVEKLVHGMWIIRSLKDTANVKRLLIFNCIIRFLLRCR